MNELPQWPADKVERRPLSTLTPYAKNARTHSSDQIQQIAASIKEFGFAMPLLVDEKDELIAGHGRALAAALLGYTEAPVMVARGWTDKQIKAYRIADNKLALNAGWDLKLLGEEMTDLVDMADLIGFSEAELRKLGIEGDAGLTDPDDVPEVAGEIITQPGDLWLCGGHRLLCGDCTSPEAVKRALGGVVPNLMVTDPPYGVNYDPEWRDGADLGIGERSKGKVNNDDRVDWKEAFDLFPGNIAYVWHAGVFASAVQASLEASGFHIRAQIIWAKQHFAMSRGDYHWQHEPCWYGVRKKGDWKGDRAQTTLWSIANANAFGGNGEEKFGHGTQKPVEVMLRAIRNNSSAGQAVYDPFVGTGTTMIAAEMESRAAICLEINPAYCDVVVKRWEKFTGQTATRENADGVIPS